LRTQSEIDLFLVWSFFRTRPKSKSTRSTEH